MIKIVLIAVLGIVSLTAKGLSVEVNYYGQRFTLEQVMQIHKLKCGNPLDISNSLKDIGVVQNANISKINKFIDLANLDGVGAYLLLKKVSIALRADPNYLTLLSYIVLSNKYDIILRYSHEGNLQLAYSSIINFSGQYSMISGVKYFSFSNVASKSNYFLYKSENKNNLGGITFMGVPSIIKGAPIKREYKFSFDKVNSSEVLTFIIDDNALAYYKDVPRMLEYNKYVLISPSNCFAFSVNNVLKDRIQNMTEQQKLNYLLAFVQSLPYHSRDKEDSSGIDPFYFPEESIFYGKTDCEDRTFLLCYLLAINTNIKPFIMDYKEHVNAGFECNSFGKDFLPANIIINKSKCYFTAETTNKKRIGEMDEKLEGLTLYKVFPLL